MRNRNVVFWMVAILALLFASRVYSAPPEFRAVCEVDTTVGGTGTLIATNDTTGLVLTCRHVARQENAKAEFHWLDAGKQVTKGKILEIVPDTTNIQWETDLAIAVCHKPKNIKPATIATFDMNDGPWYAVGYPGNHIVVVKSAHFERWGTCLVFDRPFIRGQSGGPLFNRKGELVAVVVAVDDKSGTGVACDGERLHKLLAKYGL